MNSTQLTLHSYTWSQWGFMNVPSFTGSNKAVVFFFVSVYKITHSRQGDGLNGDRGLGDIFFHLFWTFVHTVNTFLQPNGMLSCFLANMLTSFIKWTTNIQTARFTQKPLRVLPVSQSNSRPTQAWMCPCAAFSQNCHNALWFFIFIFLTYLVLRCSESLMIDF